MIGTAAAILGAAAIGGVASAVGASKSASAAQSAADAQAQAAAAQTQLNRDIYNQTRADNAPFRDIGLSAAQALSGSFVLGAPSMTGGSGGGTAPATGGVSMTGGTKTAGGFAGTSPLEPGTSAAASSPQPDYAAYGAANPDLQAEWQHIQQTGNASAFGNDPNAYYQWHYGKYGQNEGRTLPTTGAAVTDPGPVEAQPPRSDGTPAGYSDPTAPNGYMTGARPDPGQGPAAYVAKPLDVSQSAFQESPDYQFRVSEGNRALGFQSSALGGLMSGSRLKAAERFGQGLAGSEYDDWRNYTTGQYNSDRNFGYGQARDARGDFVQDRTRSDGLYSDDRGYTTGRYDTRNNQLMSLAGFGTGANSANQSAAQSFAASQNAATQTAANAKSDAAINTANAWSGALNNVGNIAGYTAGQLAGLSQPSMTNPSASWSPSGFSSWARGNW